MNRQTNCMMNKIKTFVTAMLVAGATMISTRAAAATKTNMQVLDNISIQLKVFSQGALKSNDKSFPDVVSTFTTSDLIRQLAVISSNAFTFSKSDKLVLSTVY